jgi:hypothetical protein
VSERVLERWAQRRLAVQRHVEESAAVWRRSAATRDRPTVLLRLAAPLRGRRHRRLKDRSQATLSLTAGHP